MGSSIFDIKKELLRQGYDFQLGLWQIVQQDKYQLCESYDRSVVVPTTLVYYFKSRF